MKKLRKFAAASAGTMLALSAFSAPQIANAEPSDPDTITQEQEDPGAEGEGDPDAEGGDPESENEAGTGTGTGSEDDTETEGNDNTDSNDVTGDEVGEISFDSSQDAEINPGETLTLSPDDREDNVFIETINADTETAEAWQAEGLETGEVKITAPAAPEEQEEGVDVPYGEYDFTLVANTGFEYELTLNFVAEEEDDTPEEPEEPSSVADVRDQLRNLSSNLSSGELSSNLSSN